jgi:hypothetical protein
MHLSAVTNPGDLAQIPQDKIESDDPKASRRYPVLARVANSFGTVAYASRQSTHSSWGALGIPAPGRPDDEPPGFEHASFVYPGLLYSVERDALTRNVGTLTQSEMSDILAAVPQAIGCG